jgi:ERCC4-type nuclease
MTITAVVIDSREPTWVRSLRLGSVPVAVQELSAGDACLATPDAMILVERKTPNDLLASIADDRLFNQVAEMRRQTPWTYVVITGTIDAVMGKVRIDGRSTNWSWQSLQGALATVQELGGVVVYCSGDSEYAPTLEWLAGRNHGTVRIEAKRDAVITTPAESILTALPGISEVRATALLKHCGSAAWALAFLSNGTSDKVPGIGPSTHQAARAALGLTDDLTLEVVTKP